VEDILIWLSVLPYALSKQNGSGVTLAVIGIDLLGAFSAMVVSVGMLGLEQTFGLVPPGEKDNHSFSFLMYVLLVEAFFTMILVSTVLFVKYRRVSATSGGMLSN
jgi:hypothetical protein